MGLVVNIKPNDLVLAGNPIEFEFELDNHIGQKADKGYYSFAFSSNPASNFGFTLLFDKYKVQLEAASAQLVAQDNRGILYEVGATVDDTTNSVYLALLKNVLFITFFEITKHTPAAGAHYITFKQRVPSNDNVLRLEQIDNTIFFYEVIAGTIAQRDLTYKMAVELFFESAYGSGEYEKKATLPLAPSLAGKVQLDIKRIARGAFMGIDELPNINSGGWVTTNLLRRIRVLVYEELSYLAGFEPLFQTKDITLLNGGVKFEDFPALRDFYTEWVKKSKFLSWRPKTRYITKTQPEFLAFYDYLPGGPTFALPSVGLNVSIHWTDGSASDYQLNNLDITKNQIGIFQVGWEWIENTLTLPDKEPLYYEITYQGATTGAISELIRFDIIEDNFNDRYFLYKNSFGVYDTFRTSGTLKSSTETFKNETEQNVPFNYTTNQHNLRFESEGFIERHQVSTGPKSKEELQQLIDLVNSDTVYLFKDNDLVPVVVPKGKFNFPEDGAGEYQYEQTFEFWGPKQEHYSRLNA